MFILSKSRGVSAGTSCINSQKGETDSEVPMTINTLATGISFFVVGIFIVFEKREEKKEVKT
jgi:hypothetical protein